MKKRIALIFVIAALTLSIFGVMAFAENTEISGASFTPGCSEGNYTIPEEYKDAEIIIFNKDGSVYQTSTSLIDKNNSTPISALQRAKGLVDAVAEAEAEGVVTILLRKNCTVETKFDNDGQVLGDIVIDMNGYTVTANAPMLNAQAKISNSSLRDASFTWKSGEIVVGNSGLWTCGVYGAAYNSTENDYKTMHYIFDNVKLSFSENNSATSLIADYFENSTVGRVEKSKIDDTTANAAAHLQYMGLDIKFLENSVIDLTNAPSGFTLFDANDPVISGERKSTTVSGVGYYYFNSNCITTVTVEGGLIIAPRAEIEWLKENKENGSYVHFEKGKTSGKYTLFSTSKESVFNENQTFSSTAGALKPFIYSGAGSDTDYILMPVSAISGMDFSPLVSVTLDSALALNAYVPVLDNVTAIEFDGERADLSKINKVSLASGEYYRFSIALASCEAAREIPLSVLADADGLSFKKNFVLSIPRYAEAVRSSDTHTGEEKTLAGDILLYVKSAYEHFAPEKADEIANINAVLDRDQGKISPLIPEGDATASTPGLTGVRFVLDTTPKVRFYIPDDASYSLYSFKADSKNVTAREGLDADGKFLELTVYAYMLAGEIEYYVGGELSGSYHLRSYYEFINTSEEYKDDETLVALVEGFFRYCISAKNYRLEKLGDRVHAHSYFERSFEMTKDNPGYDEKICACGDSIKNQITGIDFGDKPLKVLFVGNSYTSYNQSFMPTSFEKLAAVSGIEVDVTVVSKGSWHLWQFKDASDEGGVNYHAAFANGDFDYVFLQDGSTQTITALGEFYDGVRECGKIAEADGAKVLLYQTWGRKAGHSVLEQYGLTTETMAYTVAAAYEAIAAETGYTNSPAGSAFLDVYTNHPEIELYNSDLTHPSEIGSYLVALCHYASLFGRSPIGVEYGGGIDDPSVVEILQTAAHKAVFGESIVPEEYKTSSEGIGVVFVDNNITEIPEGSSLISVGILGDKGATASTEVGESLTAEQIQDLADISYGASVIGAKNMIRKLLTATSGTWKNSNAYRLSFDFTGEKYDITGKVDSNEPYSALITYNFGKIVNMTAYGFMSGSMDGFPQAADFYISNDGITWSIVNSGSYDATSSTSALKELDTLPADKSGNLPGTAVAFDLDSRSGGVYAKYARLGIKKGVVAANKTYDVNTLEFAVYGKDNASVLTEVPDSDMLTLTLTSSAEIAESISDTEKIADIADTKYGFSVIGISRTGRAIGAAINNVWSTTSRFSIVFDDNKYDISGNVSDTGEYEALFTFNFGDKVRLDALAYMSGTMGGFPQSQDVYISDDGVNWTKLGTACHDLAGGDPVTGVEEIPKDKDGKIAVGANSSVCVAFDMGGVYAKYVRIGVKKEG